MEAKGNITELIKILKEADIKDYFNYQDNCIKIEDWREKVLSGGELIFKQITAAKTINELIELSGELQKMRTHIELKKRVFDKGFGEVIDGKALQPYPEYFDPIMEQIISLKGYIKSRKRVLKRTDQEPKAITDHSLLFKALSMYIDGIHAAGFSHIIEHHSLPKDGTPKAIWKGIPADAHRFATFFKMKVPAFNKCFSLSIGRELRHNDKNETDSPIIAILKDYFKK